MKVLKLLLFFIFYIFYIKVLLNKNFLKKYRIRLSGKLVIRNDFFLPSHSGLAREKCILEIVSVTFGNGRQQWGRVDNGGRLSVTVRL